MVDVCDALGRKTVEAHIAQMKPVRIFAVPVRGLFAAAVGLVLDGIDLFVAAAEVEFADGFVEPKRIGIAEAVPAPMTLCTEGHAPFVEVGEGLKSRYVGRESEIAVADRERCKRVNGLHRGIVAQYDGLAVDFFGGVARKG